MIQVGYVWCCLPGSNGFQVSFELRRTSTIEGDLEKDDFVGVL